MGYELVQRTDKADKHFLRLYANTPTVSHVWHARMFGRTSHECTSNPEAALQGSSFALIVRISQQGDMPLNKFVIQHFFELLHL